MKNKVKLINIIALTAIIGFIIIACDDHKTNDTKHEAEKIMLPTHYTGILTVKNRQMWVHNNNPLRLSDAYHKFNDNSIINVDIDVMIPQDGEPDIIPVGSGKIDRGILSFEVPELIEDELLEWDDLSFIFFHEWYILNIISVDNTGVTGNKIIPITDAKKMLNLERLYSSPFSIGLESIFIIYVDSDCVITGESGGGTISGTYRFAVDAFELSLKQGWNLICKREAYNQSGAAAISVEVVNPYDFKWVIYN
jgi:hypothetical protein